MFEDVVTASEPKCAGLRNSWASVWAPEVLQRLETLPLESRRRANMVVLTNFPFHYTPATEPTLFGTVARYQVAAPLFALDDALLDAIERAAPLVGNVPRDFPVNAKRG